MTDIFGAERWQKDDDEGDDHESGEGDGGGGGDLTAEIITHISHPSGEKERKVSKLLR